MNVPEGFDCTLHSLGAVSPLAADRWGWLGPRGISPITEGLRGPRGAISVTPLSDMMGELFLTSAGPQHRHTGVDWQVVCEQPDGKGESHDVQGTELSPCCPHMCWRNLEFHHICVMSEVSRTHRWSGYLKHSHLLLHSQQLNISKMLPILILNS